MDFPKIKERYNNDGFVVLENFLTEKEIDNFKEEINLLVEDMPEQQRISTNDKKTKDENFLSSYDKLRYFFETCAVDKNGDLIMDRSIALRKIGYGLHLENKVFRNLIFDQRVKKVLRSLDIKEPGITGSMIIFKNAFIGSGVEPHQDATHTYTEPSRLVGFWIALEDATLENGCLQFIPESHKNGVYKRFVRNPDTNSDELLIYTGTMPDVDKREFVPVPVRKGDCVVFDGQLIHYSEPNKSAKSRKAFAFHITEQEGTKWFDDNWRQRPTEGFPNVYDN